MANEHRNFVRARKCVQESIERMKKAQKRQDYYEWIDCSSKGREIEQAWAERDGYQDLLI